MSNNVQEKDTTTESANDQALDDTTDARSSELETDDLKIFNWNKDERDAIPIHSSQKHISSLFERFKGSNKTLNASEEEVSPLLDFSNTEEYYNNSFGEIGHAIVFETVHFHENLGLSSRKGSNTDSDVIIRTLKSFGFKTEKCTNYTYREMMEKLEALSTTDHGDHDCLVVVVLSHGNEGILYAYDVPYPTQKIWECFTADRSPTLAGKPKLFFIQACQGNDLDEGAVVGTKKRDDSGGRTSTDSFLQYKIPIYADFLMAHSTVPGYYSWRNTQHGSWFVQSLAQILTRHHKNSDILSMLTKTSYRVAYIYESNSSKKEFHGMKQVPFIYSTLTKKFYLNTNK